MEINYMVGTLNYHCKVQHKVLLDMAKCCCCAVTTTSATVTQPAAEQQEN